MIYVTIAKTKEKKKKLKTIYQSVQPKGLVLKPISKNVSKNKIYGDNLLKHMSTLENQIAELYKSKYPADISNYYISALMRKLENLHNFHKRRDGGIYRITKPPDILQNTTNNRGELNTEDETDETDEAEFYIETLQPFEQVVRKPRKRKKTVPRRKATQRDYDSDETAYYGGKRKLTDYWPPNVDNSTKPTNSAKRYNSNYDLRINPKQVRGNGKKNIKEN